MLQEMSLVQYEYIYMHNILLYATFDQPNFHLGQQGDDHKPQFHYYFTRLPLCVSKIYEQKNQINSMENFRALKVANRLSGNSVGENKLYCQITPFLYCCWAGGKQTLCKQSSGHHCTTNKRKTKRERNGMWYQV